jgi:hypothetical protein
MKDAVELASGGMVYVPSFIKIGSEVQKFLRDTYIDTRWSHKPVYFFPNNEVMLKMRL